MTLAYGFDASPPKGMSIWISIQLSLRAIGRKCCQLRSTSRTQHGSIARMANSESSVSFRAIIGPEP